MNSIDKLREWWLHKFPVMDKELGEEFRWHLDEIEHEVEDNERFRREAEPFHDRLCRASERREDVTLWGVDYVALPVDADGEYIHVGDVMEWPDTSTAEVVGIGNDTFFYVEDGEDAAEWSCANDKIHYHAPTVEDVLTEFAAKLIERSGLTNGAAQTIAEYAAKLRLAGDE